jgi:hypothetical protein
MTEAPKIDFNTGAIEFPVPPEGLKDLAHEAWGTVAVKLEQPFLFRGVHYEKVTLRVPSGADVQRFFAAERADWTPHNWLREIVDAPREILNVMHGFDYQRLLTAASNLAGPHK